MPITGSPRKRCSATLVRLVVVELGAWIIESNRAILGEEVAVWASGIVWKLLSSPITTPVGCERWWATVTAGWVDCSMSSLPNSEIREAGLLPHEPRVLKD